MIELGQTVGNYRVTAKLGEGGMGAVYLAEHPVIGRKAALKVIHPQHARNTDVVARFVNEATAINRIGHEHIVEVIDSTDRTLALGTDRWTLAQLAIGAVKRYGKAKKS